MSDFTLVADAAALHHALLAWEGRPWLSVDTEFVREDTYYPKLALVQVGDGQQAWCIDALAIRDLSPLFAALARTDCVKVMHAASQDQEIFVHRHGDALRPLFDTQIAATLLGLGDQMGYAALVERRLGIRIDKSLSRTDWARRPLTAPELAYAAADVTHLATLYPALRAELEAAGRLGWLEEDGERLAQPARYQAAPELEWRRLKGLARLDAPAQHRAAALAAWRERLAEARNRPRKWILADEAVYALAERCPQSIAQLQALGLPPKTLERHGAALIEVLATAVVSAQPLARDDRFEGADKQCFARLQQVVKQASESRGLPATLLAPRAELEALVWQGREAPVNVLRGWRLSVVGEALLAALP